MTNTELYLHQAKSNNTNKAYITDYTSYLSYCTNNNIQAHTEDSIVSYITHMADTYKLSTIRRHLASISSNLMDLKLIDYTKSPIIKTLLKGISRSKDEVVQKATPLLLDDIKVMVESIEESQLVNARNKALLLLGFATGSRRSELSDLTVNDLTFVKDGLLIHIQHSKTGELNKAVPYGNELCPVLAVKEWLRLSKITDGYLFRNISRTGMVGDKLSSNGIAKIIKHMTECLHGSYSAHSLRSGLITTCAMAGMNDSQIMQQTGHKSANVMKGYIQNVRMFDNNVINKLNM